MFKTDWPCVAVHDFGLLMFTSIVGKDVPISKNYV